MPNKIDDGWQEGSPSGAVPESIQHAPTKRMRRPTFSGERGKILRYIAILLGLVVANLPSYQQSCDAKRQADATAERVEPVEATAKSADRQAKVFDRELDSSYRALADAVRTLTDKLAYLEDRQGKLEAMLTRTARDPAVRRYRPPRRPAAAAKPSPDLPASPAAAAAEDLRGR